MQHIARATHTPRAGQLDTALDAACSSLRTFEAALGTPPFSLPKLDLVGIPNFAAGAMENWWAALAVLAAWPPVVWRCRAAGQQGVRAGG